MPLNILITGAPGVGKTTSVERLLPLLQARKCGGFLTREIREGGVRKGFRVADLQGRGTILAHSDFRGPVRVGKYGVDIPGFEAFLRGLRLEGTQAELFLVDEIGKMECASPLFRRMILELLDSPVPLIATVALRGEGFISRVKDRNDVVLLTVTHGNRNGIPGLIRERLPAFFSPV